MKRHKFTKWNKEKISIYASAALVVCVCVVSGIYAGSQSPSKKQIIDIESGQDGESAENVTGIGTEGIGQDIADGQVEETLPVTNNGQSNIPTDARLAQNKAKAEAADDVLSADLTGDAEVVETEIEAIDGDISIPTMADNKRDEAAILHFNGEDGLSWPVIGDVIMNYSMDERIYFATLNEYKYYPAVAISAEEGAPVSSAAAGRIVKTGINEEIGQYIIMDLGDGYEATYGQLTDLTVEQGDNVSKGQIIGYVAAPTKYYSIEGTNLYFKLEQNGTSINPVGYFR